MDLLIFQIKFGDDDDGDDVDNKYLLQYDKNDLFWKVFFPNHNFLNDWNVQRDAQELLKFKTKGGSVDVRQLLPGPGNDYRCVRKMEQNIFTWCFFLLIFDLDVIE